MSPTSFARVESVNPEPLVVWNESNFCELSIEDIQYEMESLDGTAASRAGSSNREEDRVAAKEPPREIVLSKDNSISTGNLSVSEKDTDAAAEEEDKTNSKLSIPTSITPFTSFRNSYGVAPVKRLSSRSCDTTTNVDADDGLSLGSSHSHNMVNDDHNTDPMNLASTSPAPTATPTDTPTSIVVAVPLTRTHSLTRLDSLQSLQQQQASQEQQQNRRSSFLVFLQDRLSTFEANLGFLGGGRPATARGAEGPSPFARFVEARLTTFINNVEFLTGMHNQNRQTRRAILNGNQQQRGEGEETEEGTIVAMSGASRAKTTTGTDGTDNSVVSQHSSHL